MGWHAVELAESVQVVPDYEADHVLGLACWCGPKVDDGGRLPLVSHRDLAERAGLPVDVWHAAG
jgi:hypothetical protein